MGFFSSTTDLFELIPKDDSQTTLTTARADQLLSQDGRPIVVIDDWPSVTTASTVPDEMSLRKDTVTVLGIVAAVALILSFLAGRATVREAEALTLPASSTNGAPLPTGVYDAMAAASQSPPPASTAQPSQPPASIGAPLSLPAPTAGPAPAPATPAPLREVAKGAWFMQVVSTVPEKAEAVAKFLNEDASSPIAGRADLQAYVSGGKAVKIRGFKDKDDGILNRVHAMKDPTGGGRFNGALYLKER